ncbi:hypothetical protein HAZT_HAZT009477 [Hyalella azteca]|uniref:Glycoside hydrolase family 31 TIM barrel domain-containing protein n=1 Tax=Hyalella azteca TaxID=294128 RepID=A0A6A0H396_HYAAZ|nr:hypothetical protein HAZT_HAZT009477 [Hyalella azteca]
MPPPSALGYVIAGAKVPTETGFKVPLSKLGDPVFQDPIVNVTFEVFILADHLLRVKLYDASESRFEVPIVLNLPSSSASSPLYELKLTSEVPGDVFDTSLGGLILEDQFLSVTTLLPSKNVYGMGENTHPSFRTQMDGTVWSLFARDQWPEVDISPTDYQFLDYPSLTYRTIGGILDFFFVLGPEPETVTSQYTALIGRPVMPPYWALGFQLSRLYFMYGYEDLQHMKDAMNRTLQLDIPIDVQYADIDHMDRQKDFTLDEEKFGGLGAYAEELHASGHRFIIILDPAINLSESEYPTHARALAADAYIKWPEGTDQATLDYNNGGGSSMMLAYVWPENRTAFPNWHKQATQEWWTKEIRLFHQKIPFDGLWIV